MKIEYIVYRGDPEIFIKGRGGIEPIKDTSIWTGFVANTIGGFQRGLLPGEAERYSTLEQANHTQKLTTQTTGRKDWKIAQVTTDGLKVAYDFGWEEK